MESIKRRVAEMSKEPEPLPTTGGVPAAMKWFSGLYRHKKECRDRILGAAVNQIDECEKAGRSGELDDLVAVSRTLAKAEEQTCHLQTIEAYIRTMAERAVDPECYEYRRLPKEWEYDNEQHEDVFYIPENYYYDPAEGNALMRVSELATAGLVQPGDILMPAELYRCNHVYVVTSRLGVEEMDDLDSSGGHGAYGLLPEFYRRLGEDAGFSAADIRGAYFKISGYEEVFLVSEPESEDDN